MQNSSEQQHGVYQIAVKHYSPSCSNDPSDPTDTRKRQPTRSYPRGPHITPNGVRRDDQGESGGPRQERGGGGGAKCGRRLFTAGGGGAKCGRRLFTAAAPLFRRIVRFLVVGILCQQLHSQYQEYRSQPVSSTVFRRQAPFPRLTLCPGSPLRDTVILQEAETLLANGNVTLDQFYNISTMLLLNGEAYNNWPNWVRVGEPVPSKGNIASRSRLGSWGARFYFILSRLGHKVYPMRCFTLEPSEYLRARGKSPVQLEMILAAAPPFTESRGIAYRLFVHGDEEPNVGDLAAQEMGPQVPQTLVQELGVGRDLSLRLTARLLSLINLRRRPCRTDPGYSETQCLKECLWRRLAANISCRLPHMVGAGVYLPDMSGPLDHLPLCARPVQVETARSGSPIRFCKRQAVECGKRCIKSWYKPGGSLPLVENKTYHHKSTTLKTVSKIRLFNLCSSPPNLQTFLQNELLTSTRGCDCPSACHQTLYDMLAYTGHIQDVNQTRSCQTRLVLFIDLTAEELRETIAFTTATLLANIGGLIGALTGVSLFTLTEAGESMISRFTQRWRT